MEHSASGLELPSQASLATKNGARWAEVVADPKLANLEERIETDRFGRVVISPQASARHGSYQFRIGALLDELLQGGRVVTECPISTADGVKAADVAWASAQQIADLADSICFLRAPKICVEILSPANTEAELREKTVLYLDAGAAEVWHCSELGEMKFFGADARQMPRSKLCPAFPAQVTF